MPSVVSRFQDGPERKRKAHAKSRKGCGNCKIRRIKCDETRPHCKKCVSYGVSCNYDGKKPTLDLTAQGSFQVDLTSAPEIPQGPKDGPFGPRMPLMSINQATVCMINASLERAPTSNVGNWQQRGLWTITEEDIDTMRRFQTRTVLTIGTTRTAPAYRDCIWNLALGHPFLMQMVLSLTLMHDAHLASKNGDHLVAEKCSKDALQRWNTGTTIFNQVLSRPILPSSRDALWATAAIMGSLVFAYVETTDVEKSWPLKPSNPNDLDWLKLSEGKKAIWQIASPNRADSVFNSVSKEHFWALAAAWINQDDTSGLSNSMTKLMDIGPESTIKNNPYHLPALLLSHLQHLVPTHDNVLNFLYFMGCMTSEYKMLLETKDPRALLLLGWWFRMLEVGELWWLTRRAAVEGRAVKVWLERFYGGEEGLAQMFEVLGARRFPANQMLII
ncbi:hypothetical protein P154DRAFT_553725 [Amniculicola lignicola CBS 123094]|uniref:Zn(2)-C6 fungal-type domain-containing protein n=1 Tax=Amniculicola lignicola CBS 123094 TaxID=1392246 RepID=A0A6A5WMR2_9PLEO|nr:hypothetical protein P154DRAFT_553725 [Amniculicola lignicola CBS 123094]